MTNKPRDWPNVAREVRDRSAEAACEGIRALEPIVMAEQQFTETELLRRVNKGLNLFQRIARLLESVGAQTRP